MRKEGGGVIRCDCCRIVFGDLLWFWRCWQTSKLLGLGPWDDMLSHPWYSIRLSLRRCSVNQPQPWWFPAIMISVFWGGDDIRGIVQIFYILHVSELRCRPHVCFFLFFFQTSTFTFQFRVSRPKMYCPVKPFELHFEESGIWFQMIAPAHAYALYKHEKAR